MTDELEFLQLLAMIAPDEYNDVLIELPLICALPYR